jgi:hypothetical protein
MKKECNCKEGKLIKDNGDSVVLECEHGNLILIKDGDC